MSDATNNSSSANSSGVTWTSVQAYTLAVVCLLLGMAGGWLIRGSQSPPHPSKQPAPAHPRPQPWAQRRTPSPPLTS